MPWGRETAQAVLVLVLISIGMVEFFFLLPSSQDSRLFLNQGEFGDCVAFPALACVLGGKMENSVL